MILADKVSIGIPLDVALRELSGRIKLTEYQFFSTALTLQARSGGGITQTLETLAEVIRKRVALKQRGYALTSEARTSALILSCLPFVAGGAIFVMQRDYINLLFTTTGGQACLGAAILLMMTGMGIIQYMISSVLK
jgi:tight adherence protein B